MQSASAALYQRSGSYFYSKDGCKMNNSKPLTITGCILWIAGLAVFIIGLNMSGDMKEWMTVIGSIAFLAGLGITGAIRMKKKKEDEK